MIVDIISKPHYDFLLKRSPKFVVIFYRKKGLKSTNIIRFLSDLSKKLEYITINFTSIDYDVFSELVDMYRIDDPATILFIKDGKIVNVIRSSDDTGLIYDYTHELLLS